MAKHARLTAGQQWLAAGYVIFGLALTPISFIVMLLTVQKLLAPTLGFWAWSVPVGTEAGFIGLFCADLLLEWKHRPLRVLRLAPYLFAAISLALNVIAARGVVSGILGHAVLPLVFFGYILVAEAVVRRLSVTEDERALEVAMADALAHARDLARDRLGVFWRLRCPSLLSRQIRSGRATAAVRDAAASGVQADLEAEVGRWVAAGLAVTAKAEVTAEMARQEITRTPAAAPAAEHLPKALPEVSAAPVPKAITEGTAKPSVSAVQRVRRLGGRKATDEDIRSAIREMYADGGKVTKYRVVKELKGPHGGIAEPRAGRLLDEVQAERPSLAAVVG
jgi:hypothetical protein